MNLRYQICQSVFNNQACRYGDHCLFAYHSLEVPAVYVLGIPIKWEDADVRKLFKRCGAITAVRFVTQPGHSTHAVFVNYKQMKEAKAAIDLFDYYPVDADGSRLSVISTKSPKPQPVSTKITFIKPAPDPKPAYQPPSASQWMARQDAALAYWKKPKAKPTVEVKAVQPPEPEEEEEIDAEPGLEQIEGFTPSPLPNFNHNFGSFNDGSADGPLG